MTLKSINILKFEMMLKIFQFIIKLSQELAQTFRHILTTL